MHKSQRLILLNTYIWRLLNFGDIGGWGKERENITPPILYAKLNRDSDKMVNPMSI